jgi:excinuclease ABC subunit A
MVVVDEPTAGLSLCEVPRIVAALRQIQATRNSVIAVDHSAALLAAADHLIELGPKAGPDGGCVIYQGSPSNRELIEDVSISKSCSVQGCVSPAARLVLSNVNCRNQRYLSVEFPLGQLSAIAGPSGSGKTVLLTQVIYPAICRFLGQADETKCRGECELSGADGFVDVVLVDQTPLTRSKRSNPATWLEVFAEIRQTFALTADAKLKGFTSQHFSFNSSSGGRCRSCLGTGLLKHDMQFLPDVTLVCPECKGTRYRSEILDVKYRGQSIAEVLAMSVSEAASFFRSQPKLQTRFRMLEQIGLDYLVLGQPSETLSGGEAQRLKLASRLIAPGRGPSLILCDEPTTGLHASDVGRLVACFRELIANGHTIILADNNASMLAAADVVVDLGSN